jgi:hypothetical protein
MPWSLGLRQVKGLNESVQKKGLEHLHGCPQNNGWQDAGRSVLSAPAEPSKILELGSHTGGPKTLTTKKVQYKCNSNSNTYKFMKCKYNIVYTNK